MAEPVILDGGMSNALEDLGHDLSDALWSARLLRDDPGAIAAVHRSYYEAGATIATTASYQASLPGFQAAGMSREEAERLITRSVEIARDVSDEFDGRLVAASVGPYGAYLADGSEYRGRYGVSKSALREFHLPRLELLVGAGPDLLAVETIPDLDEAEVLVELLTELAFPAWFSYSIDGSRTRAGQPLADAFAITAVAPVVAAGVNCCRPAEVRTALETAATITGKPAVAYPNSGQAWDAAARDWVGDPVALTTYAPGWIAAGASYVGGCCRVGPDTIRALATLAARTNREEPHGFRLADLATDDPAG